jgi:DNA-binding response OmpR family regulator
MKKNIGFISIDSSLAVWLYEKIRLSAPNTGGAGELEEGMAELISGETSSLMLEIGGEEENKENNKESSGKNRALLSDDAISCGDLTVYGRNRKVVRDGEEISLTPKEFDILYFLVRNRGEVFTKEQIYQAVWENDYMLDDSNIMAFIRKLRKKIEPNPDAPEYILTIWGIGYKFNDRI